VSNEDVPKLGKFIHFEPSEDASEWRDAIISGRGYKPLRVRIGIHGPELYAFKMTPIPANAGMAVKHRAD
jgi:hypothetical protein